MVYFTEIRPTEHYLEHHVQDVPWETVVQIILTTKNPRKKGTKFEIETEDYYVLFAIEDAILHIINAKKVRT